VRCALVPLDVEIMFNIDGWQKQFAVDLPYLDGSRLNCRAASRNCRTAPYAFCFPVTNFSFSRNRL
jgi:hypothetical protein